MKTLLYIAITLGLLASAIFWSVLSLFDVQGCLKEPVWFARSGAFIVLFSALSGFVTKPYLKEKGAIDTLDSYKSIRDGVEAKPIHWLKKLKIAEVFFGIEIIFLVIGTYIWAYGDIWLSNCT